MGACDGWVVGSEVGNLVGVREGEALGWTVVGCAVAKVGACDGGAVGAVDGDDVGRVGGTKQSGDTGCGVAPINNGRLNCRQRGKFLAYSANVMDRYVRLLKTTDSPGD